MLKKKETSAIPSEFLDISIMSYSDASRKHYVKNMIYNMVNGIPSYNIHQVYEDLLYVLFIQSYIVPWTDAKYEKRIGRSIIFGLIHAKLNNSNVFDKLIRLIELIHLHINGEIFPYKYICDNKFVYIGENEDNYDKVIKSLIDNLAYNCKGEYISDYESLRFNSEYEIIQDYLRHIIYFGSLYHKDDATYLKFINNNREKYMRNIILEEHQKLFVDEYRQAFKKLLAIMHLYISNFSQILNNPQVIKNINKYR